MAQGLLRKARARRTPKLSRRQRRLFYAGRRMLFVALLAAAIAALVLADQWGVFGRAPSTDFRKYHARTFRVVHVVDGDTLDVDVADGKHKTTRIRLWGVDTPEVVKPNTPPQHFGPEASAFTKRLCSGQQVKLELNSDKTRGKYGRLLAYVILPDGQMLNRLLIEEGYGYADPRFPHDYSGEFARAETRARRARKGLWKDVRQADLPYYDRGRFELPKD